MVGIRRRRRDDFITREEQLEARGIYLKELAVRGLSRVLLPQDGREIDTRPVRRRQAGELRKTQKQKTGRIKAV
jgi:hypothetical protein